MWVLEKLRFIGSDSYYSPVYFLTAVVFSAIAAIWPGYFKRVLMFILAIELCWLIILCIQGNENGAGFERITFLNFSLFALVAYLFKVGAYWGGYAAGELGLSDGLAWLFCEMIILGLSFILVLPIRKLSIWLTENWMGEDLMIQEI
jgi:hypothetical protein